MRAVCRWDGRIWEVKCVIQIAGIVSLKAATRADEMAMTALTIHAQEGTRPGK